MRSLKTIRRLCFGVGLLSISASGLAMDVANGRALHDENCLRCHTTELYSGEKSKIKSIEQLKNRVSQCELNLELAWFGEEVDDVTAYLNQFFYKFPVPEK